MEPVATALASAGIGIIEVTLRNDVAPSAIEIIRRQVPELFVGAGTIRSPDDFQRARDAGAQFAVSPGVTDELLAEANSRDLPFLPGAATVSEIMRLHELGYNTIKFFPAESMGGIEALAAIGQPLPDLSFCPSGGIDEENFLDWLQLENVVGVGGSWLTPAQAIDEQDWKSIEKLAIATITRLRERTGR